ncbi:MAG: TRAP transporter small permease subunit [Rhodospirillales bacterium]|nr:TRAP transporter small permease subunit [Alphaproteobacteria bacterium]MBL6928748.1 TRAP transporter small permease subunit [Rhodospirillales bacterium]
MRLLAKITALLGAVNTAILTAGRQIAWVALVVMVFVILLQVFCRYVLNNALPWPEEAARSLMIWMMAFMAPSGYRWGAFVSIDLIPDALPPVVRRALHMAIFVLSTIILVILLEKATKHFGSGFIFRSSSLMHMPLAYIYLAMSVCLGLMLSVNIEMIMRTIGRTFGNVDDFPKPATPKFIAEG